MTDVLLLEEALKAWSLEPTDTGASPPQPESDNKRYLVTSALPYVNNVPHLGNIIGSTLSADVFARYCRLRGRQTLAICGTDEYGTAIEIKAIQDKTTPQAICDKYHKLHSEIYSWFSIEFDHFGRTSTQHQTELSQAIFKKVHENGFILEESMDQLYCEKCTMFLADRFISGTCSDPKCGYTDARGDQCDKCSRLSNAIELKDPKCKICNSTPIVKSSKHLFLDLPKLEPEIRKWYEETTGNPSNHWTQTAKSNTAPWFREGLKPRCITRDLKWGTKVPLKGFEDKVFYVWFDAPIGYLSITRELTQDWEKWWKCPEQVELFQFMAKDNVPFHSIIMPGTQLASKEKFTMLRHLIAIEYLNYGDDKFSKSRGVGVFGNDAQSTGIASDVWRFYLIYVRPENQDTSFNWGDLLLKNNQELLNNVGNFVNRALTFLFNNFDGVIQPIELSDSEKRLLVNINLEIKEFIRLMNIASLRDSLRVLLKISSLGNQAMQESKPWDLIKSAETADKTRAASVVSLLANIGALLSLLFSPFIPVTCKTLREQLNLSQDTFTGDCFTQILKPGHKINKPSPLFRRIQTDEITALEAKFSGKSDEKKKNTKDKANKKKPGKPKEGKIETKKEQEGEKVTDVKAE